MSEQRYVEGIGEAEYQQEATHFVAELHLELHAGKRQVAMKEIDEFHAEVMRWLRDAGLVEGEVIEGGATYGNAWFLRKKSAKRGYRKIILRVDDYNRLNDALAELEAVEARPKKTIQITMGQPKFGASTVVQADILKAAFEAAREKAEALAEPMEAQIGKVLRVQEQAWARQRSGFTGDDDRTGDSDRFAATVARKGYHLADSTDAAIASELLAMRATRTIFVQCTARFELLPRRSTADSRD